MSLSKYYKSSTSFQPEDIVKPPQPRNDGWESSIPDESVSSEFHQQTVTSPPQESQRENGEDVAGGLSLENGGDGEAISVETLDALDKDAQSEDQVVDLNDYIDKTQAKEEIEAAYQKGLQEGEEKAEQDFGTAARTLITTCQQLDSVRETLIGNSRKEVVDFSLAIAERIIRTSVLAQDTTVIATIEEALQRAVKSDEFTIYVHPEDYDKVVDKSDELVTGLSGLNNVVVKKDITVERGGANISSENCLIDCTISSQFDVIREELQKSL